MFKIELTPEALFAGLALIGGLIVWLMKLQRAISSKMSFKDHKDICDQKHEEIRGFFEEIKEEMRDDRNLALAHREGVNNSLGAIRTDVAVLKSHSPEGLFDDAGRFRGPRS